MGGPSKTLCLIFLCVCTFVEFFSKSAPETVQTSQPLHTWPWQGTSWEQPACREPEGRPWKPGVPLTTRLAVARQGTEAGGVRGGRGPQRRLPAPLRAKPGRPAPGAAPGPRGKPRPRGHPASRSRAPGTCASAGSAASPGQRARPRPRPRPLGGVSCTFGPGWRGLQRAAGVGAWGTPRGGGHR